MCDQGQSMVPDPLGSALVSQASESTLESLRLRYVDQVGACQANELVARLLRVAPMRKGPLGEYLRRVSR